MSDIHALSGAYAVDALDDDERSHFERHLSGCPTCSAEVDSLREASALLAETTIAVPSAALRERVLAEIANIRPLPPEIDPQRVAAEVSGRHTATVTELAPRRRRRVVSFLAAAAAVVAIGGGAVVVQQVVADGPSSRTEQVLEAGDAQQFRVDLGDGASATVTRSKKLNEAVIVTNDMPAAPSGSKFVLWLDHDGVKTPAGVMPEGSDNTVLLAGDAASATGAAVSVEDADTEPTTPSDEIVADISFTT